MFVIYEIETVDYCSSRLDTLVFDRSCGIMMSGSLAKNTTTTPYTPLVGLRRARFQQESCRVLNRLKINVGRWPTNASWEAVSLIENDILRTVKDPKYFLRLRRAFSHLLKENVRRTTVYRRKT